jgi:septal ring factor EnvC (AmiA/AmiB activator)
MCIPKPPKPDPAIKAAQEAQARAAQQRASELKANQYETSKRSAAGTGIRSLISSVGGFGRNFF